MDLKWTSSFKSKALSTLRMGLQQHLVPNVFLRPHWHSAEPTPHHLHGLNYWLGILIGFSLPRIETGYSIFCCASSICLFPSTMSLHKGRIERGRGREELLEAKFLIANISSKATGMFNKSAQ